MLHTLTRQNIYFSFIASLLVFIIVGLAGTTFLVDYARAEDFLRYRLAQNLREGNGMVFNPGEDALFSSAPLWVALLALVPVPGPDLALWLNALAYGLSAGSIFRLACRGPATPNWQAVLVLVIWLIAWPLWASLRSPAALSFALSLIALEVGLQQRWRLVGLVAGFSALSGPGGLIGTLLLGLFFLTYPHSGRYWQTVWIFPALGIIWALLSFDAGDLNTLLLAQGAPPGPTWLGAVWLWLLVDSALTLAGASTRGWVWFIVLWAGAQAMFQLLFFQELTPFALPSLALAFALAVVIGSRYLPTTPRYALFAVVLMGSAALLIAFPPETAEEIQRDLDLGEHLDLAAYDTLAHDRSDALTYAADFDGNIYRLDGQRSPAVADYVQREDYQSLIVSHAPDALYFNAEDGPFADFDPDAEWLRGLQYEQDTAIQDLPGYREGDQLWIRQARLGNFTDARPANIEYGLDVKLVGYALDRDHLTPGKNIRVRLDWELNQFPNAGMGVYLNLVPVEGGTPIASIFPSFPAANWQTNELSTYHILSLPADVGPRVVDLTVTLNYQSGYLGEQAIARLRIPPNLFVNPETVAAQPLGDLGPVQLVGADVTHRDEQLLVEVVWKVTEAINRDYQVFVHLIPAGEVAPAQQNLDGRPLDGRYPTRFWQASDQIPDSFAVPLEGVGPGKYVLRIGFFSLEDGTRLNGTSGDNILIATLDIAPDGTIEIDTP